MLKNLANRTLTVLPFPTVLPFLTVLIFLTVLQSLSGKVFGQDNLAGTGNFPKNRETYYEASKQKILENYDKAIELFKKSLDQEPADAAAMCELASIYAEQGNIAEATPLAEKAVALDPSNKWFKMLLIQLYQVQGKYKDAGVIINQLLMAEPGNIEYYQDQALNYIYDNDYKNAVKSYDILEQKLGINEDVSIQKEKIYIMMGKPDKAIEEIQKLSGAFPDEPRYLEMLAELYMTSGMDDQALAIYNEILRIDPENPYINISLSDYYRKKGDKVKSFEYLKAGFANPSLDIDSKVSILLAYYSVTEIYNSYKDEAFELAAILIKAHPDNPKSHSIYADFLVQDKRYAEAHEAFLKVISLDSTKYLVWEQLLYVESELNDNQAIVSESKRALELFPEQPMLYLFAGAANFQLKDFEAAVKYFKNGVNFVVGNDKMLAQFYSYLGDTYFQLKDHQHSDEAYEKALKIEPSNALVLNNYAYYLSLRNVDLDKAEQMAKKAVELDPGNGSNQDTYGWVLFRLGRYEEAKEWIEKAIQTGEESAVVLEHYGDVMWKLGNKKDAVKYWEKAGKAGEGSEFLQKKIQGKTYYE
ncbi:MAG: tetratricopeptide repeat protein [Bacteroidales bacterium]|nr:tetratricopeptide repeat protein [Bacteroidales bacterium]